MNFCFQKDGIGVHFSILITKTLNIILKNKHKEL